MGLPGRGALAARTSALHRRRQQNGPAALDDGVTRALASLEGSPPCFPSIAFQAATISNSVRHSRQPSAERM
jgi:hypothetical protein